MKERSKRGSGIKTRAACEGAGRSYLRKTRLRLIGSLLLTSKRRRASSSFDDRRNVSSKKRSAGTQAVACQALWARTGRQRYIAYRLSAAPCTRKKCSLENVSFTSAASAKNTELAARRLQTETARRPQKQDRQRILFTQKEVAKTDPKMGPPRGPFCVTVQSKTEPDKRSPRFLLHILECERS